MLQRTARDEQPPLLPPLFDFEAGETLGAIEAYLGGDYTPALPAKAKALTFFTVQKLKPSRVKIPKCAPRLPDSCAASNVHDVSKWDRKLRVATILTKSADERPTRPYILNSSLLTVDDFTSMAVWVDKQPVAYQVGDAQMGQSLLSEPSSQKLLADMQNTRPAARMCILTSWTRTRNRSGSWSHWLRAASRCVSRRRLARARG